MGKLVRKGNDENNTRISFFDINVWDGLVNFVNGREKVYIFGDGKIGKALAFYFNEAQIRYAGHITSETMPLLKESYEKGKCGIILGLSDLYYPEIMPGLLSVADESDIFRIPETEKGYLQNQFTKDNIKNGFWITFYATYFCNLNCRSCLTRSPICKPDYYDYDQLVKDIARIKELGLEVHRLNFSGGEPFLHPRALDLFRLARGAFGNVPTTVYTNGSLCHKLTDSEIQELADIGVEIAITEYPVPNDSYHDNLKRFYERADKLGLSTQIILDVADKEFYRHPYNLSGDEPKHSFFMCHRYRNCYMVCAYNGQFTKCYSAKTVREFNEAFGTSIPVSDRDFIDIHTDITADDVYGFCMKRTPLCSYCAPPKDTIPWGISERKIEEWI